MNVVWSLVLGVHIYIQKLSVIRLEFLITNLLRA